MREYTTISVKKTTLARLKELKNHPRETIEDVILRLMHSESSSYIREVETCGK